MSWLRRKSLPPSDDRMHQQGFASSSPIPPVLKRLYFLNAKELKTHLPALTRTGFLNEKAVNPQGQAERRQPHQDDISHGGRKTIQEPPG